MTTPESGLTQPSSPAPSGTTPPAGAPATAPSTEPVRFGDDYPEWMRGRTPDEVTAVAQQLAAVTHQYVMQGQPAPPVQPDPEPFQIDPDDPITGRQLQEYLARLQGQAAQQFRQMQAPTVTTLAQTALSIVKDRQKEMFARYGPEIDVMLAHVPKDHWNIDNLNEVVNLVRAKHLDEIVEEQVARRRAAKDSPGIRSTGAAGTDTESPSAGPDAGLTDEQRSTLRRNGVTLSTVQEFCRSTNMPVDRWFELYGKHAVGDAE